jgi:hypothetical protein
MSALLSIMAYPGHAPDDCLIVLAMVVVQHHSFLERLSVAFVQSPVVPAARVLLQQQ